MSTERPLLRVRVTKRHAAAYLVVVVLFLGIVARFYQPGIGFNYLIAFGGKQQLPQVSALVRVDHLRQPDGYGYDGQYYAQIAMHPSLRNPELKTAIDNLPYRARRILTSWSAYLFGLGQPARILQAFAMQNLITWLLLAAILLHWFPPNSWDNWFRWTGVLAGAGVCQSLRLALIDAPSLLLVCLGVWCVERNRRGWATAFLALSGLARETMLLGATSLIRPESPRLRHLAELAWRGALIALPLAAWLVYIRLVAGPSGSAGLRNFSLPLVAFLQHWGEAWRLATADGPAALWKIDLLVTLGLTTQLGFLLFRPQPREVWWRVGIGFAGLMVILGPAVWEGPVGAAARVLLPMQVAFNVLAPRSRRGWLLLALGNLSLVGAPHLLEPPPGPGYRLIAPGGSLARGEQRTEVGIRFDDRWYSAEHRKDRTWRWAPIEAAFTLHNRQAQPRAVALRFHLDALTPRPISIVQGEHEVWRGLAQPEGALIELTPIILPPGDTTFRFVAHGPPEKLQSHDERSVAFALRNFEVQLLEPYQPEPVAASGR